MWRAKTPQNINRASPFYTGRLFISSVKPRAFKPTFQVKLIAHKLTCVLLIVVRQFKNETYQSQDVFYVNEIIQILLDFSDFD
jgi:hypothetical protein